MLTSRTCYIFLPGAREVIVRFCGKPIRYTSEALRVRSALSFNGYSVTSKWPLAGLECTADELICNANADFQCKCIACAVGNLGAWPLT